MSSSQASKGLLSGGIGKVLLIAAFFHGYGAPVFDSVRPSFLDQPLKEYRHAIATISSGREIGLEEPLIDALAPIRQTMSLIMAPVASNPDKKQQQR